MRKILVSGMTLGVEQADVTSVCNEQVQEGITVGKVDDLMRD